MSENSNERFRCWAEQTANQLRAKRLQESLSQSDIGAGVSETFSSLVLPPVWRGFPSNDKVQHYWMRLVMDVQLVAAVRQDEAIAIASSLRDRYPNKSIDQLGEAVRSGRLYRDNGFFLADERLDQEVMSAHQAQSVADLLNRMATPTGELEAIGDCTCKNNARSPYLRCAVNPCGPCEGCSFFEVCDRNE